MSSDGRQRGHRRRRALFALLAATLGLAAAVAALECALRVFDPIGRNYHTEFTAYRGQAIDYAWQALPPPAPGQLPAGLDLDGSLYRHKPNLDLLLGSFRVRTNSLRFRGPEVARQKPPGAFRIVVLGDSVAFGWGVDEEVTFVRRFEAEWNGAGRTPRLEVVDTAMPLYDSVQELAVLRDDGLPLQPDLVVLIYVVNDIEPTRDVVEENFLGHKPHPEEDPPPPSDPWTRAANAVQGLLPATADLLRLQVDPTAVWAEALAKNHGDYVPEKFGKGPRGWVRSQQALRQMRDLCAGRKVPFVVLDNTMPAVRALPEFCRAEAIPYHELRFTESERQQRHMNSRLDPHLNAHGHAMLLQHFARVLAPYLPAH